MVVVERDSPFPFPKVFEVEGYPKTARLQQMQRSLGVVEGTITEFDDERDEGTLEVDGHGFDCFDVRPRWRRRRPKSLDACVGDTRRFSFWPSFAMKPREPGDEPPRGNLPAFNISHVRYGEEIVEANRVEVIGKLSRMWRGGFAVTLWSKTRSTFLHTVLVGDYPDRNHVGQWVWVVGHFDPSSGRIHFEEATALSFVDHDDANAIERLDREEQQRREEEAAQAAAESEGEGLTEEEE
jgi:hypothetical protein